jgi:DNA primase large subunit
VKRRYARAEANALRRFLEKEPQLAAQLAADLDVKITDASVPFVAYANAAPEQYKLVNAELESGVVRLRRQDTLVEFVAELFRQRIEEDIAKPMKVPERYTSIAAEIKGEVNRDKAYSSVKEMNLGPVSTSEFPPCITALIEQAQSGAPMAHQPRFTLSTFLINANMPVDAIIEIFRNTPNFNENKTRYYIEYSMGKKGSGTKYSAPSCEKMKFYGTCVNPDALCNRIKHPLSYYIVKMRGKKEASKNA